MEIAIKSECDSRALLYPLIKVLYNYGTVAVYSSNRYICRLIENEMEGGFRNVRIVVNTEADLDSAKESDEYFKDKYDYVIYDNMGSIDYDMLICMVTNRLSENYVNDLIYIASDPKTHIVKFGNPAPVDKSEKKKKEKAKPKPKKGKGAPIAEEVEEEVAEPEQDDRDFNKWNVEKSDEELLSEALADKDIKWCKFPSYDAIEQMESRYVMITPDDTLIKELYKLLGTALAVDERQFTKGAKIKDEGSSVVGGADVR